MPLLALFLLLGHLPFATLEILEEVERREREMAHCGVLLHVRGARALDPNEALGKRPVCIAACGCEGIADTLCRGSIAWLPLGDVEVDLKLARFPAVGQRRLEAGPAAPSRRRCHRH